METPKDLPSPEIALACAALVFAALAARSKLKWLGRWERPLARLAGSRWLAVLTVALFPMILRAILLPLFPVPEPRLHDEFTFLLGAGTLLEGRLANPPHPFWPHFESMHILTRPAYASAFPLAQAATLALGMLLGHPWIGVWLSVGVMCGAIGWMLGGWLPPRWALLGGLMVGLRLGVSSYWMNSFWGGAVAATGGALVLGALPRMRRAPHWGQAVVMGIGLAILANSRSFEGAVFGLMVGAALTVWMLGRNGPPRAVAARQIIIPLALQLTLLAAGLGFYFARVTGSPWTPPYLLYRSSLTSAPHFLWQSPRPEPLYNNREMRHFYTGLEMSAFRHARGAPLAHLMEKTGYYWRFYFGPIFTIPLISLPLLWRDRASRQLLLMMAGIWLALAGQVWHNAHYAAPATGLFILIVILGMRRLRVWRWRGRPTGACLVRILPLAACAMLILQISAGRAPAQADVVAGWRWPAAGGLARARVLEALDRSGGKHLIFVRYGPWHDPGDEWVYNGADIDGSRVVWARELDRFSNARLMAYFGSRRVWLIEPDLPSPQAVPYQHAQPRPMPFVQLGAPGIESLRSVEELGRKIHAQAGDRLLSCDQWNYYFTEVSGVMGPEVSNGCYSGNDRGQSISFENYFSWLQRQR